jgi:hypothetical protein
VIALLQVVVQPAPPVPPVPEIPILPPWMTLPPQTTLLMVLGFIAGCTIVLYPLMRAISRRIEGRSANTDPAVIKEIESLRNRVADLEQWHHRVGELEERLDFAERLLAQHREVGRIGRSEGG